MTESGVLGMKIVVVTVPSYSEPGIHGHPLHTAVDLRRRAVVIVSWIDASVRISQGGSKIQIHFDPSLCMDKL